MSKINDPSAPDARELQCHADLWLLKRAKDAPNPDQWSAVDVTAGYIAGVLAERSRRGWKTVQGNGLPACDGEHVFVGVNSNGFACVFNAMRDDTCLMETPEGSIELMSDLRWWYALDLPGLAPAAGATQPTPVAQDAPAAVPAWPDYVSEAVQEMDQCIRLTRGYIAAGERPAEINADDVHRWRMALSRLAAYVATPAPPEQEPALVPLDVLDAWSDKIRIMAASMHRAYREAHAFDLLAEIKKVMERAPC